MFQSITRDTSYVDITYTLNWLHVSAAPAIMTSISYYKQQQSTLLRSSLCREAKQPGLVVNYGRFGTTYRSIFKSKAVH